MPILTLTLFDRHVHVQCPDPEVMDLVNVNYGQMRTDIVGADLRYRISRESTSSFFRLTRKTNAPLFAANDSELLFLLEKDLTVEMQKLRSDLYFLHAAVLGFRGKACLLVAPSGGGKSLTTWALLHHGFHYSSDELGPVDLNTLTVFPYPRLIRFLSIHFLPLAQSIFRQPRFPQQCVRSRFH